MKKRIISGIKPSGDLHIGNYLGAIRQWIGMQEEFDVTLFVADLHAITVPQDPEDLRRRTIEIAKIYLAAGIDPAKATVFVQSHVPEHAELCWILNTIAKNGDLTKMTQFKDKSGFDIERFENLLAKGSFKKLKQVFAEKKIASNIEGKELLDFEDTLIAGAVGATQQMLQEFKSFKEQFNSVGMGLFDYPVLMAGDILMYDAELVPVGEDQVQHIELTRTIGRRFNKRFGETFRIPQPLLEKEGARVMGLDNPAKKMSKSAASEYNYIALNDDPEKARKKIMKAVTDSGSEIVYRDDKPALKNLINIYSLFSGMSTAEVERAYAGRGYADFKRGLADVVAGFLEDFQGKYDAISDEDVKRILREGAEKVRPLAQKKIEEVKQRVGFLL
jgi:tryptophanyl-tRNA synthetase